MKVQSSNSIIFCATVDAARLKGRVAEWSVDQLPAEYQWFETISRVAPSLVAPNTAKHVLSVAIDAKVLPLVATRARARTEHTQRRRALRDSTIALERGDLVEAHAVLAPFPGDSDISGRIAEIRNRAVALLEEDIASAKQAVRLDLTQVITRANQFSDVLSSADHVRFSRWPRR